MINSNYNFERQKKNHFPVFKTRLAKFLMNNGMICVDISLNKKIEQYGRIVFFFNDTPELQELINKYTAIYSE